ncbi:MAG: ATP-grasp domain-containing protein [Spirochaetia bacterium]|nr:ATP-grasp domain-containing protein [Bacteroidia bacterium]MCS7299904.1 ATP-grasp domain-containing protein [Spirochaetota bacterium]MDW8113283.1 ATP-grasp domain-containing protein [Spirochaetia bacterium]MDW8302244.1 ATP-grasp domain-containing protein [Bacteroidia bacterium]MDW8463858.1 ATP-grasp domain-containing protein [Geminocystis sp.]
MKILISPAGGGTIAGVVDYFRKKGYSPIGIDSNKHATGAPLFDKFFTVPKVSEPDYEEYVGRIIAKEDVDFYISWLEPEILFWNEKFLSQGLKWRTIFLMNFRKDLQSLQDKYLLYNKLKTLGIELPKTSKLTNYMHYQDSVDYPIVIKPRLSSGGKGLIIAEDYQDINCVVERLKRKKIELDDFIIQNYIQGDEYSVDFFAIKGKVLNMVVRRRIAHSGFSTVGEVVESSVLENLVSTIASKLALEGLYNIQFIQRNDTFYPTDLNCRPSGTIILSIMSGVDLLQNFIEWKTGQQITIFGKPKHLKMYRLYKEIFVYD